MSMKLAYDFHGVLEAYPEILKEILSSLTMFHEVIILSGPPMEQIKEELLNSGYKEFVHYDKIISVVDWIKDQGVEMKLNKQGSWYCDDEIWWASKAKICVENNIEVLHDDSLKYKEHIVDNNPLFIHIQ